MNITMTAPRIQNGGRLVGFRMLVVGALIGFALMYVFIQAVLIKAVQMPLPIFSVVSVVLAALVAGRPVGGWRWTPMLGVVWSLVLLGGNSRLAVHHLAHPEDLLPFAAQLVLLALTTIAIVAGVGATVQNYRQPASERQMPHWVGRGLMAMIGLLIGAVAVAAIPQSNAGVQIAPAQLAQLPSIPLSVFGGGEIRIKAGELTALRLQNPDAAGHSFDVDALDIHVIMPSNRESLALFTVDTPGTYTFYCAPHYDKTTGKGMHGTLIVEQ